MLSGDLITKLIKCTRGETTPATIGDITLANMVWLKNVRLNIDPFDPAQTNPNSHDLRLGNLIRIYPENLRHKGMAWDRLDRNRELWKNVVSEDVDAFKTLAGSPGGDVLDTAKEPKTILFSIPKDGLVIHPGVLYLGHTVEAVSCKGLVPVLDGKSSVGRCGIKVHETAGFGDNGFSGTFTLEMTCVFPVRVYAGSRICQVSFHPVEGDPKPEYKGRYTGQTGPVASGWHKDFSPKTENKSFLDT